MTINEEFKQIIKEIIEQKWSAAEWAGHEADDWFQTPHFEGGFEADETYENGEFNFSHTDAEGKEWWFTFSLGDISNLMESGFSAVKLVDPVDYDDNQPY